MNMRLASGLARPSYNTGCLRTTHRITNGFCLPLALCVCSEKDIGECDELYDIVGHEEDDEDIYDDLMTVQSRCSVIAVRPFLAVTVSIHLR